MQGHLNFVLCQGCLQALRLGPLRLAIPAAQSLPHTLTACNPSCAVDSAIQHPVSSTRQSLMQGTVPAQTDITRGHFRACLSKAIHRRDSQDCHGYARQHAQPTVEQGPHTGCHHKRASKMSLNTAMIVTRTAWAAMAVFGGTHWSRGLSGSAASPTPSPAPAVAACTRPGCWMSLPSSGTCTRERQDLSATMQPL